MWQRTHWRLKSFFSISLFFFFCSFSLSLSLSLFPRENSLYELCITYVSRSWILSFSLRHYFVQKSIWRVENTTLPAFFFPFYFLRFCQVHGYSEQHHKFRRVVTTWLSRIIKFERNFRGGGSDFVSFFSININT